MSVVIVGAGPAGIAAAVTLSDSGERVTLLDDNPCAGGQIWRGGNTKASPWLERLTRSTIVVVTGARVLSGDAARQTLLVDINGKAEELTYSKLVLATGARELFIPFPGWTLPNIMGVGGLQALVKSGLPVAGKRIVVAGSGPLLLAVAAYLRKAGAIVPLIAEQASAKSLASFALSLAAHPAKLRQALQLNPFLSGTRYLTSCWVESANPANQKFPSQPDQKFATRPDQMFANQVDQKFANPADQRLASPVGQAFSLPIPSPKLATVRLRRGTHIWEEPCDYLANSHGFIANTELALYLGCVPQAGAIQVDEWQQSSVSNIYCAGEIAGIGGVDTALLEGQIAALAVSGQPGQAAKLRPRLRKARSFARLLNQTFNPRAELRALAQPDTVVCRCEDVTLARLRQADSWRSAKLLERCGMGPCQGRICGPAVQFMLGWEPSSLRPPLFPTRLENLIQENSVK